MGKLEQPFEHLTDGQIEHYGEEQAGAGPEQNQQLEAHLADCSGCRTRVLAFHRARFTPGATSTSTQRPMSDSALTAARLPDCPAGDDLRNLAAGLTPPDQAAPLIQHAAQCAHCGPILSMYTEDFSDGLSPEDQAVLAKLKSASPEWQKKLVRKLQGSDAQSGAAVASSRSIFKLPWFRWLLVPAATAAVAAIAFFVWYERRDTPQEVEKLLAQAYTEQRTMEMRIPGAQWGESRTTRGPVSLHKPLPLLEANEAIRRQPPQALSEPKWLHIRAQAEILSGKPSDEVIRDLKAALERQPDSIPLMFDLASADFRAGELTQDTDPYVQSKTILDEILKRLPSNSVALFNRAIVEQRLSMRDAAIADFTACLNSEREPAWSNEIRRRLAELQELP